MINLKIGAIIIGAFVAGAFVMSPVPQAIAAVIATDVQCTGCVGTADVGGNAITAAKIKDGDVKAAEIATDAVGAAELQGVTKLLFGQCKLTSTESTINILPDHGLLVVCNIAGVDSDDTAVALVNGPGNCFNARLASPFTDKVYVSVMNECANTQQLGTQSRIALIVYDK